MALQPDAESQEQCPNLYAAAWKTAEEERPEPLIWTTASSRRFAGDVESLNKASPTASDMDTQSGAPDVASEPEAKKSSRFLQLIGLQMSVLRMDQNSCQQSCSP